MTKPMINALTIENFKSIETLELKPKRINLFVGKPNAGKSNILEALSLFSIPQQADLRDFIRFAKLRHLFYNGDVKKPIKVSVTNGEELYDIQEIVTVSKQDEGFTVRFKSVQKIPHRANIVGETELVELSSGIAQISDQNTTLEFVQLATPIAESKSNQFFIATHSPYLFNTIIEETP
ncbi:MAG: AAA family ATPase, partial [Chlorobiales bacterium]